MKCIKCGKNIEELTNENNDGQVDDVYCEECIKEKQDKESSLSIEVSEDVLKYM